MKRVVLVRPIGPRNAGLAMRAVANFGPAELVIVAPRRPSLLVHPEFEQMAHGVEDVRARVTVVDALDQALADCHWAVGFTARPRDDRERRDWREARDELAALGDDPEQRLALVFGSDEGGLDRDEVERCQELVHLPTSPEHTSINLAMSVGIVLSSLFTERGVHRRERGVHRIEARAREYLKEHLKSVFAGQVARSAAAARDIEASIERIFSRAPLENRDARAWHQMLRALGSRRTPQDLGGVGWPKQARREEARRRARERASPRDGDDAR